MPLKIIITGGGTGGHLFPALAVAEQFVERSPDCQVLFIGAGRYIDLKALEGRGFNHKSIRCGGLKGGTIFSKVKSMVNLPLGFMQSLAIIRKFRPHLVFGVGGYVTAPVTLAAKLLGVPVCIHEQNSVPGMANRKIGRFADKIFVSIPGSEGYFPKDKCLLSGNPVRRDFLLKRTENNNRREVVTSDHSFTVMVIGGSQGAHALNCMVPEAISILKERFAGDVTVIHQTGRQDEKKVDSDYERFGISHTVSAFFNNMAECISQADLIICRAGATTLAELTTLGKPSMLVPYPFATDDHQAKNATFLVQGGAAKMFRQEELDPKRLAEEMSDLLGNPLKMQEMSRNAEKLARPEAPKDIVEECMKMMGEGGRMKDKG